MNTMRQFIALAESETSELEEYFTTDAEAHDQIAYDCDSREEYFRVMRALEDALIAHDDVSAQSTPRYFSNGYAGFIRFSGPKAQVASFKNMLAASLRA